MKILDNIKNSAKFKEKKARFDHWWFFNGNPPHTQGGLSFVDLILIIGFMLGSSFLVFTLYSAITFVPSYKQIIQQSSTVKLDKEFEMVSSKEGMLFIAKTDSFYIFSPAGFMEKCDSSLTTLNEIKVNNIRNIYLSFIGLLHVESPNMHKPTLLYKIQDKQFESLQCKDFSYKNSILYYMNKPVYWVLPEPSFINQLLI